MLVPFALAAALLLLIAQLPLSLWLIRRVGRAQDERRTLLHNSLTASDRERRSIAADLHDGVVQDLAGASYVLGALSRSLPEDTPPRTHKMLDSAGSAVKSSIASLRTLMVDIYPPDLTGGGLPSAIDDLALRLQSATGAEVSTDIRLHVGLTTAVAAAVYRCARECLDNVRKHAEAHHVSLLLTADAAGLHMLIVDDGVGFPATVLSRTEGHLGLQLMRDAAKDLGGQLHVWSDAVTGTTVTLALPSTAVEESDPAAYFAEGRPLKASAV